MNRCASSSNSNRFRTLSDAIVHFIFPEAQ